MGSVDARKAYGLVTAVGTKLGEKARADADLPARLRAAPDLASFQALLRRESEGLLAPALVEAFVSGVLTDADWVPWRSRLLLQLKMVRDGGKPAPGHEAGKGTAHGRP